MRTIKFRVWDKLGKLMIKSKDLGMFEFLKDNWGRDSSICVNGEIYDCILMQYTGLKTKGKEIYEDDIVEFMGERLRVGFYNAHFIIYSRGGHEDLWKALKRSDVKIVGDVHKNPKLLKDTYNIKDNEKGGE